MERFWLFKLVTGKEGMGYGDFKLLGALGAWFGWQAVPLVILLSSFVGAALGIAILIARQNKPHALRPLYGWSGAANPKFWRHADQRIPATREPLICCA